MSSNVELLKGLEDKSTSGSEEVMPLMFGGDVFVTRSRLN